MGTEGNEGIRMEDEGKSFRGHKPSPDDKVKMLHPPSGGSSVQPAPPKPPPPPPLPTLQQPPEPPPINIMREGSSVPQGANEAPEITSSEGPWVAMQADPMSVPVSLVSPHPVETDYRALYGLALAEKEDLKRERDQLQQQFDGFKKKMLELDAEGRCCKTTGCECLYVLEERRHLEKNIEALTVERDELKAALDSSSEEIDRLLKINDNLRGARESKYQAEKEDLKRARDQLKAEVARLNGETAKRILDHSVERSAYRKASDDVLEAANSKIRKIEMERDALLASSDELLEALAAMLQAVIEHGRNTDLEGRTHSPVCDCASCMAKRDAEVKAQLAIQRHVGRRQSEK